MNPSTAHASSRNAGSFNLADGKALTLRPARAGVLRVKQGRVWATTEGSLGDHVLVPGSCLQVPARSAVVIEAWALPDASAVLFDWEPALGRAAASQTPAAERQALAQALGDLRAALALAGAAAGRLAIGAVRLALCALARPVLSALA